jgi:hypothetical protein
LSLYQISIAAVKIAVNSDLIYGVEVFVDQKSRQACLGSILRVLQSPNQDVS